MSVPPSNPLMGMAMQSMQNPNAQAVPPAQGGIDAGTHPVIASILKALAGGMQSFGSSGMGPQERVQRQQMEQEKAQAMAQLAQGQQGLGIKQQEANTQQAGQQSEAGYRTGQLGLEGQRVGIEGAAQQATAANQKGMLGVAQTNAATDKQRADQEYEQKKRQIDNEVTKTTAEYGPGGLRSQEVSNQKTEAGAAASHAATSAKLAVLAGERDTAEEAHWAAESQRAGLGTDRTALEDQRKARIDAQREIFSKAPWWKPESTAADEMNKSIAKINKDIDGKIAVAEKAAGTGAGAAKSATPGGSGGAPTPQSHTFSISVYQKANPGGDAKSAAAAAQNDGFTVNP